MSEQVEKKMKSASSIPPRVPVNLRYINIGFTVLYSLLATAVIVAPFWGVNYEVFYQFAMLLWIPSIAFAMVAANAFGNENYKRTGRYTVGRGVRILIILGCVFSILTIWLPAYNLLNILINQCPQYADDLNVPPPPPPDPCLCPTCTIYQQQYCDTNTVRAFKICANEQGWAIFLIIAFILIAILDLVTAVVYSIVMV